MISRGSSVAERFLGKKEVVSSILTSGSVIICNYKFSMIIYLKIEN